MTNDEVSRLEEAGDDFIITKDGSIVTRANACIISYVDCKSKKTEIVTLTPGQEFSYGDWDGKKCVRKRYKCE